MIKLAYYNIIFVHKYYIFLGVLKNFGYQNSVIIKYSGRGRGQQYYIYTRNNATVAQINNIDVTRGFLCNKRKKDLSLHKDFVRSKI